MSRIIECKTTTGSTIEFIVETAEKPKGIILVWPCTMGDVRMYRTPLDRFAQNGYTGILYNPAGHGQSEGQFRIANAVEDLYQFICDFNKAGLPIISVGHSGGSSGLLKLGMRTPTEKYFLVAPVLDSRKSLIYMYRERTIEEFNLIVSETAVDRASIISVLENDAWMSPEYWYANRLQEKMNKASADKFLIGSFIEHLFIKGVSAYPELEAQSEKVRLLLPSEDKWYPLDSTKDFARRHNIPVNEPPDASDHYFTRAWKNVWENILYRL